MRVKRRDFAKMTLGAAASLGLMESAFAEEDKPNPKGKRFLLYIHFGSSCGIASGLIQPPAPGKWPVGFFQSGVAANSNNPLLNAHTAAGKFVWHDYLKFLAPMNTEMCLVNGTPQSLDHVVARVLQTRGVTQNALGPEWGMGMTEFMQTATRKNPIMISKGPKTNSTSDVTLLSADNITDFQAMTSDGPTLPKANVDPIWEALKGRFAKTNLTTVNTDPSLAASAQYQLSTLLKGMPELNGIGPDRTALTAALDKNTISALVKDSADNVGITAEFDEDFRQNLILAGILAKSGIAQSMNIDALGEDNHNGGADVLTARRAASRWAMIYQFWQWVKTSNLQNDVMIIVGQEFSRSPYNVTSTSHDIIGLDGKKMTVTAPGRDHGVSMGTIFINPAVPGNSRFGIVAGNLVPQATTDGNGKVDTSLSPFVSADIVGSMMMRVYPDLFPTERMVRKHWPAFKPIGSILS